jgi:hypothetical protein
MVRLALLAAPLEKICYRRLDRAAQDRATQILSPLIFIRYQYAIWAGSYRLSSSMRESPSWSNVWLTFRLARLPLD